MAPEEASSKLMETPSDNYIGHAVEAFRDASHRHRDDNGEHAVLFEQSRELLEPFLTRFYPVLRHYRPEIVGQCLALSYDDPQLGRTSQLHGFGMDMKAGLHPQDMEGAQGSFRDDGSYLAILAFDFFEGRLR